MHAGSEPLRVLVVAGGSVRGFAESAARAGWTVYAADLFRDLDLVAAAHEAVLVTESAAYPAGVVGACTGFPPAAWCYTGGLENHPDVIAAVSRDRRLWGNGPEAVQNVRDPMLLAAAVRAAGLDVPETIDDVARVPADGSFLCKPRDSAGGRGIHRWFGDHDDATPTRARVWQRFVPGRSWAASLVLGLEKPRVLGLSRQFTGLAWCHARPFAYCGSLDLPLADVDRRILDQLERLASVLAETCGVVGLVGVDLVADTADRLTVIEVNPRPTASMELHERSTGESLAAAHVAACGGPPPTGPPQAAAPGFWAKSILFASDTVEVSPAMIDALAVLASPWSHEDGRPAIADIPCPPQRIDSGRPLVTVFARGGTPRDAWRSLARRTVRVDRLFRRGDPRLAGIGQPASRRDDAAAGVSAPRL